MPSSGEGFGLVYLEAMRAGLPCLGSVDDAAADIIRDGETGFLVSPGDPRGMSQAIVALLENEPLRRTYGSAGRRRFEAEFTLERFVDRFQPLLEPLVRAKRPMTR
jgi:glycosyltransferase involved in cell wall biosynthesis